MFDKDSFSSGQIGSKLWLCEELEKLTWSSNLTRIYGGWYGVLSLLLLSRGKFKVNKIESFDVDESCQHIADMLNEYWVWQNWKFKAFTQDCNTLDSSSADLIINTSSEHFTSMDWFDNIKQGTRVIIQGNNMNHSDHVIHSNSLDEFLNTYKLTQVSFSGEKEFVYPDWKFTRYMVIGEK